VCCFSFLLLLHYREKREEKKKRSRREEKKIERERKSLSPTPRAGGPPKRTFVCFASSSSPPISMCCVDTLSARARILLSMILSLCYVCIPLRFFFRFLKLFSQNSRCVRNKIRIRNSKKRRRRRRVYFLFPSLSLSRFSRALENKRILYSLSFSLLFLLRRERGCEENARVEENASELLFRVLFSLAKKRAARVSLPLPQKKK